ncbi:MAG: hypothetical protein KDC34_10215 [Saprospiraceae bacterium]|nr:hypothetical protein [Saprospiraceae bacterium]
MLDILLLPIRFLMWMPRRLIRVGLHVWCGLRHGQPFAWSRGARPLGPHYGMWWLELMLLLVDLAGLPEWYEIGNRLFKWKTRRLSPEELKTGKEVYGDSIPWFWLRLDSWARLGTRRLKIAYVSFCTINFWEKLVPSVFVHELDHVWQFHQWGSVYILRALVAQRTVEGYNYGGFENLKSAQLAGLSLFDFNYEQQADIIADRWRISHGAKPVWNSGEPNLEVYDYFLKDLQRDKEQDVV